MMDYAERCSRAHNLSPELVKAIIKAESNGERFAVSPKGAQGMMQLMPFTAKQLNVSDPFDPIENIEGGVKYIKELLGTFGGNLDPRRGRVQRRPRGGEEVRRNSPLRGDPTLRPEGDEPLPAILYRRMNGNNRLNPANLLTLFRILTVPVVVLLLYTPDGRDISFSRSVAAVILFTVSSFTDLFDGYIARRYAMVTSLGKLLDPLADKLLICAAMVMLIPSGRVPAWMVAIIVGREIGVTALRGAASTEGFVIAASSLGKAKTILLSIGVGALILNYPVFGVDIHLLGMVFLVAGLVLTAWSGLDYFLRFVGEIFKK